MPEFRNVSPQGDQIVEGRFVKHGDTIKTDSNLDDNPHFERVDVSRKSDDTTEGN